MSDAATTTTTAAPAPAPAPAPAAAPAAAPAPAPAPAAATLPAAAPAAAAPAPAPAASESLIHGDAAAAPAPGAAPAPAPAPADPFAEILGKVPEKFHVKGDGDKLDAAATLAKALEHREHLEKRMGAGDMPPKTAAEYGFQMPEDMKDFSLKEDRLTAFKEEALKQGITGKQFEFMMTSYLKAVPDLMEGAATMTAAQTRAELQKVWSTNEQFEAGISNAQRALRGLPADLVEATRELGTNAAFLRAMAHMGAQMREDTTPGSTPAVVTADVDVQALVASPAYRDPKNPDHARVSKQVADYYAKAYGTAPI